MLRYLFFFASLFLSITHFAGQPVNYTVANLHAHNDYEKPAPYWAAYNQGFGSIEADIFLRGNELIVAHDTAQVKMGRTLDSLYLKPLQLCIQRNNGHPYADPARGLQLLIDLKTEGLPTLAALVEKLKAYPLITSSANVFIVITGNRPPAATYSSYPGFIWFDGELSAAYPATAMDRILMLSDDFKKYATWNGKGSLTAAERRAVVQGIAKAHELHKKVRFWNAPDAINSWYHFMRLGVDYINTDQVAASAAFLQQLPDRIYSSATNYNAYTPKYRNDGTALKVKNVILLIGDGTGLPQLYAGYTANHGALNVFNMRHTGLSKTSSYDSYITDSAPGSTAFSSGEKTNNRAVGVDHNGQSLTLLPDLLIKRKMKTGIISSGDIADATPADFYAHQPDRGSSAAILKDLLSSPIQILMGEGNPQLSPALAQQLSTKFTLRSTLDSVSIDATQRWLVTDKRAGLSMLEGRGDWALRAFNKTVSLLEKDKNGFFLMLEGAQVDHGGHENKLPYVVTEVLDFDKVIGRAMEFADSNGETLVIVTADHETGGLTLLDGDYNKGFVSGQFSTSDHTASPVPVFAYGPGAQLFTGVFENTALFNKILQALGVKK
ncbi:MAG TPA: alkaline phosphatase [Chitinophagaceae bacterium]|nr:alkaline phosphatase [Chitinophagaceae bacterium]